ncbi:MAG: acetylxylan esterase [Planctomycetaceae bacterium]|nr:acetylxylan esterase [Planctomycetaceae bacterium]
MTIRLAEHLMSPPVLSACRLIMLTVFAATLTAAGPKDPQRPQSPSARYRQHQNLMIVRGAHGKSRPVTSPADWKVRRKHVLDGMQRVMGSLPGKPFRVPLAMKVLETTRIGPIIRRKITFRSDPSGRVAAYLFLPPGTKQPAVLCLQQTHRPGKVEAAGISGNPDLAYASHLAKRGYVTLAPDYPGFGESTYDFAARHGYHSGTMKAIWDNIRAVDLLQTLPEVDGDRIGVIGHSLGGHNAMFTAAFDQRLRVIVSNCGFTRFHKDDVPSWTGPRYMPLIKTRFGNDAERVPFDFPEIIGLFAPRPFLAIAARKDRDFDFTGVADSLDAARPVYRLFKATAHLQGHFPDIGHSFPKTAREVAYRFLDKHLK